MKDMDWQLHMVLIRNAMLGTLSNGENGQWHKGWQDQRRAIKGSISLDYMVWRRIATWLRNKRTCRHDIVLQLWWRRMEDDNEHNTYNSWMQLPAHFQHDQQATMTFSLTSILRCSAEYMMQHAQSVDLRSSFIFTWYIFDCMHDTYQRQASHLSCWDTKTNVSLMVFSNDNDKVAILVR